MFFYKTVKNGSRNKFKQNIAYTDNCGIIIRKLGYR